MAHHTQPLGDEAWFLTCTSLAMVISLCVAESPGLVLEGASKDLTGFGTLSIHCSSSGAFEVPQKGTGTVVPYCDPESSVQTLCIPAD